MGVKVEFRNVIEPLTPAAEPDQAEKSWISSEAYSSLVNQFRRYCSGEVLGQSLLIAGHRGSGKTTLTHAAIQKVRWEADGKLDTTGTAFSAVPFLVSLHGPDLFDSVNCDADNPDTYEKRLAEQAMRRIMVALHRAFCDEISTRFGQKLKTTRLRELGAQLTIELDDMPSLQRLRDYWERAGYLPLGLLNRTTSPSKGQLRLLPPGGWDQGHRELIALDTCIHAARSIRIHAEPEREAALTLQSPDGMKLSNVQLRELLHAALPVLSLVAGGFSAFTVIESLGPSLAGVVAVLTVVVTYIFLMRTGDPSRERTQLPDATSASFDVFMPVLMQRLLQAGFAPIFVVDELDKVDDLSRKMSNLMRRLKYFVTDRAIFCFLADRQFFEDFRAQVRSSAYPPQDTYFAELFFVHFQPREIHSYLRRMLSESEKDNYKDGKDLHLVRYILVFRCESHLNDLWRQLSQETTEDGYQIRFGTDPVETVLGYRMAIFIQVAIEYCLESEQMQRRMRQDPNFTQWVLDALYYPVRCWRRGEERLDVSPEAFKKYLESRVFPPTDIAGSKAPHRIFRTPAHTTAELTRRLSLEEPDFVFLREHLMNLVDYLINPQKLVCKLQVLTNSGQGVRLPTCISRIATEAPSLLTTLEDNRLLRWNFTDYGRPAKESTWADDYVKRCSSGNRSQERLKILFSRLITLSSLTPLPGGNLFRLLKAMSETRQTPEEHLGIFDQHVDAGRELREAWRKWLETEQSISVEERLATFDKEIVAEDEEEEQLGLLTQLRFTESIVQTFFPVIAHAILQFWITRPPRTHPSFNLQEALLELRRGQLAFEDEIRAVTLLAAPEELREEYVLKQRPQYSDHWLRMMESFRQKLLHLPSHSEQTGE